MRADLKRAVVSWRFLLLLALGLLLLYQPVFYLKKVADGYRDMELLDAVMCASGLGYYTSALPLLSGLTYADSFAWEYAGGAFPYILQREGRIRYIVSKVLITSVVSGILVSMSFVLFCGMHILLFVPQMPTKAEVSVVIHGVVAGRTCLFGNCSQSCDCNGIAILHRAIYVVAERCLWTSNP